MIHETYNTELRNLNYCTLCHHQLTSPQKIERWSWRIEESRSANKTLRAGKIRGGDPSAIDRSIAIRLSGQEVKKNDEEKKTRAKCSWTGINASQTVGRVDSAEKPALSRDGGPLSSTKYFMIGSP